MALWLIKHLKWIKLIKNYLPGLKLCQKYSFFNSAPKLPKSTLLKMFWATQKIEYSNQLLDHPNLSEQNILSLFMLFILT